MTHKPWRHSKGTTTERGLGWSWQQQRVRILARDCGLCQPCKRKGQLTQASEVDHIIPRAKGGEADDDNLQAICIPCHKAKTLQDEGKKARPVIGPDGWPVT